MTRITPEKFEDFFRYFQSQDGQRQGVRTLYGAIANDSPKLLEDNAGWMEQYRRHYPPPHPVHDNPLGVPFFDQKDNGPNGWRQCQTSSIAMCLKFLSVKGIGDDTDYLRVVREFGDTTDHASHHKALTHLGVPHRFRTDMHKADLIEEINKGFPVAIGILHHGYYTNPSGGGHYICLRGTNELHMLVHDPYGELDLLNGGWASQAIGAGKDQAYSWKHTLPRWDIGGGGWGWTFS